MAVKKYNINPLAILFHPELDKKNGYTTLASNPQTGEFIKVNQKDYFLLKIIEDNNDITVSGLQEHLGSDYSGDYLKEKLDNFIKENIIFENE